jgi:hypothetical protein
MEPGSDALLGARAARARESVHTGLIIAFTLLEALLRQLEIFATFSN